MTQLPPPSKQPPSAASIAIIIGIVLIVFVAIGGVIAAAIFATGSQVSVITSILSISAPTVAALLALLKSNENAAKLDGLHIDLNSRLTQLLTVTGTAQRAEGVVQGRAESKEETPQ